MNKLMFMIICFFSFQTWALSPSLATAPAADFAFCSQSANDLAIKTIFAQEGISCMASKYLPTYQVEGRDHTYVVGIECTSGAGLYTSIISLINHCTELDPAFLVSFQAEQI